MVRTHSVTSLVAGHDHDQISNIIGTDEGQGIVFVTAAIILLNPPGSIINRMGKVLVIQLPEAMVQSRIVVGHGTGDLLWIELTQVVDDMRQ